MKTWPHMGMRLMRRFGISLNRHMVQNMDDRTVLSIVGTGIVVLELDYMPWDTL